MKLGQPTTAHRWLQLPDDQLSLYNQLDTTATAWAALALQQELADQGMREFWETAVWPLVPAVLDMQARGQQVDRQGKSNLRRRLRAELAEVDELILAKAPEELRKATKAAPNSLGSRPKVAAYLKSLGAKLSKFTEKTKSTSVDQEALLAAYRDTPKSNKVARVVLENLLHRSRLVTLDTRYLDFQVDSDGRVRPTVKMGGTETGRFAYADPALQQYPPEIRHILTAPDGYCIVGADYEQLEARISTYLAGVRVDMERFENGVDVHSATAMEVFGYDQARWDDLEPTPRKALRNFAKSFRYRLDYGGDPTSVGALGSKVFCPCPRCADLAPPTANLPAGTIQQASQRYLGNRPEVQQRRAQILADARQHHAISNPFGRKRFVFGPVDRVKRELFNWPIQSTAADVINRAMRQLWADYKAPFWLQMHDYLGLEVPITEAELWKQRLKAAMEAPVPEMGGISFPVEVKVERPWDTKFVI